MKNIEVDLKRIERVALAYLLWNIGLAAIMSIVASILLAVAQQKSTSGLNGLVVIAVAWLGVAAYSVLSALFWFQVAHKRSADARQPNLKDTEVPVYAVMSPFAGLIIFLIGETNGNTEPIRFSGRSVLALDSQPLQNLLQSIFAPYKLVNQQALIDSPQVQALNDPVSRKPILFLFDHRAQLVLFGLPALLGPYMKLVQSTIRK